MHFTSTMAAGIGFARRARRLSALGASLIAAVLLPGMARAQTPSTTWTAQASQSDCNTTTTFNSNQPNAESGACQSYNADIYEKWDPNGSSPGQVDLLACDYAADTNFYYMRWDVRTNWSDEGHRYYQELEINRSLAGGDNWPDIYLEYAPKGEHIGSTWRALGQSQIFLSRDANNNYGCSTSRLTPSADSCADGYDADVTISSTDAYGRVVNGNLEVAVRRSRLDTVDDSTAQVAPVAVRCWTSQSSTIDESKLAWHDEHPTSDLTGDRFDNNLGIDTATWPIVDPTPVVPLTLAKASAAHSDPSNGLINPKMIPGGRMTYTITVDNPGSRAVTANSIVITDPLPTQLSLATSDFGSAGSGPIAFSGAGTGLTYSFVSLASTTDDVDFSNNGGSTWTYVPAAGVDPAITHIRILPKGSMAAGSSFSIQFRGEIE